MRDRKLNSREMIDLQSQSLNPILSKDHRWNTTSRNITSARAINEVLYQNRIIFLLHVIGHVVTIPTWFLEISAPSIHCQ